MQWAIEKLAKYRSKHVIESVKDWNEDIRLGYQLVCSTDEIRVHPKRGGGFYHDPGEIAQLSRISQGILPKIDWSGRAVVETFSDAEIITLAARSGLEVSRA